MAGNAVWLDNSPYRWPFKPSMAQARLNSRHQLGDSLVAFFPINEGSGTQVADAISSKRGTLPSSITMGPGIGGPSAIATGTGTVTSIASPSWGPTCSSVFRFRQDVGQYCPIFGNDTGGNNGLRFGTADGAGATGRLYFVWGGVASYTFNTLLPTLGKWYTAAITVTGNAGTGTGYLYDHTTNTMATGTVAVGTKGVTAATRMSIFGDLFGVYDGRVDYLAFYNNRVLTQSEVLQWATNPYGIFLPPTTRRFFPVPSTSGLLLKRRRAILAA